jgi:hypothetical protein
MDRIVHYCALYSTVLQLLCCTVLQSCDSQAAGCVWHCTAACQLASECS